MVTREVSFRLRRDSATDWAIKNSVLGPGELGLDEDSGRIKIGDGVTPWNGLEYKIFGSTIDSAKFYAEFSINSTGYADNFVDFVDVIGNLPSWVDLVDGMAVIKETVFITGVASGEGQIDFTNAVVKPDWDKYSDLSEYFQYKRPDFNSYNSIASVYWWREVSYPELSNLMIAGDVGTGLEAQTAPSTPGGIVFFPDTIIRAVVNGTAQDADNQQILDGVVSGRMMLTLLKIGDLPTFELP